MTRTISLQIVGQCGCSVMFTSFVTLWTVSHQGPLSMGFPRNLKDPGIEPVSSALAGGFFTTELPWEAPLYKSPMGKCYSSNHKNA